MPPLWTRHPYGSVFFGRDYHGAFKTYCRIVLAGEKAPRAHMSRALRTVADYAQKRMQFDNHASYREVRGVHFQDVQTKATKIRSYQTRTPSRSSHGGCCGTLFVRFRANHLLKRSPPAISWDDTASPRPQQRHGSESESLV